MQPRDAIGASEGAPADSGRTVFLDPPSAAALIGEVQKSSVRRDYIVANENISSVAPSSFHPPTKKLRDELGALVTQDGATPFLR